MDDVTHIGFVNSHTERHGSDDDIDFIANEHFLIAFARGVVQSRVIGQGSYPASFSEPAMFSTSLRLMQYTMPDSCTGFVAVTMDDLQRLPQATIKRLHAVRQVGSIERSDQYPGCAQAKLSRDVIPHVLRSGRSIGMNRHAREPLLEHAQARYSGRKSCPSR